MPSELYRGGRTRSVRPFPLFAVLVRDAARGDGFRLDDRPVAAGVDPTDDLRDHLAARAVPAGIDVDAEVEQLLIIEAPGILDLIQGLDQLARVLQTQLRLIVELLPDIGDPADVRDVVEEDPAVADVMERNHDDDLRVVEVL